MMGWFRRRDGDDGLDGFGGFDADELLEAREAREAQILKDVCAAIDVINANISQLPRGIYPWMQWRPTPRLTLVASNPVDRQVLHGDGFTRMRFD